MNARTTQRAPGGRGGVEVGRWLHIHHSHFHHRLLAARLRPLLTEDP